ncbi:MAG: lipid-A-disaccharide synthase N-terminal domain-containing protein [Chloroflexota bacterium]
MIEKIINYFQFDFWVLWGLAAQGFFFIRLIIQWLRSEKEQKTIVPLSFWWLGILGALMLGVYAVIRHDLVFLLTSLLQLVIYSRNFSIALKSKGQVSVE